MLSILIPVYNFDVNELVNALCRQSQDCNIDFEIILLDDNSNEKYKNLNRRSAQHPAVIYEELKHNIGRSRIRNMLAGKAQYPHLLFLDCDSELLDDQYIKRYTAFCDGERIVCGGRSYKHMPPDDHQLYFRWYYGVKRESPNAAKRKMYPNRSFLSNNFLIAKSLFDKIKFDENICSYGHEDTLFGYSLRKMGVQIEHIDNPLIHIGLETTNVFLEKSRDAITNIKFIYQNHSNDPALINDIFLLRTYKVLKRIGMNRIIAMLYRLMHNRFENNLQGKNPSLFIFDLYKLGYLAVIA